MESLDSETMIIIAIVGVLFLILLINLVLSIIGMWKIFTKAGEKGWKSLIPFYNQYTLAIITGVSPWWILIVLGASLISGLVPAISLIGTAASIYFNVVQSVSLAKSFGKDEAFAVGIFFLSPIFYFILGVGKAEYLGKQPMNDPIMDFINKK